MPRAIIAGAVALGIVGAILPTGAAAGQNRILGGAAGPIETLPYMAGIFNKGRYICSGTVIAPRFVLTAGHCNIGPATDYQVVTGRTNLADPSVGQVIPVIQSFSSPDYAETPKGPRGHDLSILALASPTTAPPLGIATEAEGAAAIVPGAVLGVAGWGATNKQQKAISTTQLKFTFIRAIGNARCKPFRAAFKPASMICTAGPKLTPGSKRSFRTSACSGDSGAPLGANTATGPKVIGVVSYGPRLCGLPFVPVVYAKAFDTFARNFIATTVLTPLP